MVIVLHFQDYIKENEEKVKKDAEDGILEPEIAKPPTKDMIASTLELTLID